VQVKRIVLFAIGMGIFMMYKAYRSLQTIFRSKQIHRNNKIRLYRTLIKPMLCYGSVTWTLTQTSEQMLNTFERKILRRIYGPTHEGGCWRPR
jgi:hypothetical protein